MSVAKPLVPGVGCCAIQAAIMSDRSDQFVMPNFTPRGWFECDVMEITRSGYLREYEVKVSRSDFLADAKKRRGVWAPDSVPPKTSHYEYKHDLLRDGDPRGPKQFWFVVPEGLIAPKEVPDFAGLIYVKLNQWGYVSLKRRKDAPVLHNERASQSVEKAAIRSSHYRLVRHLVESWRHKPIEERGVEGTHER